MAIELAMAFFVRDPFSRPLAPLKRPSPMVQVAASKSSALGSSNSWLRRVSVLEGAVKVSWLTVISIAREPMPTRTPLVGADLKAVVTWLSRLRVAPPFTAPRAKSSACLASGASGLAEARP